MSNEELVRLIQEGVNVTENLGILYQQNKGLIRLWCRKYVGSGIMDLEDLMQESYFALVGAVNEYNLSDSAKFTSYLKYSIRNQCFRCMEKNQPTVRISNRMFYKIRQYKRLYAEYHDELDPDVVMQTLDITKKDYDLMMQTITNSAYISMDQKAHEDGDTTILDVVGDDHDTLQHIIDLEREEELSHIWDYIEDLNNEREVTILLLRYRLNMSQSEVAKNLGISSSRLGFIERRSLKKLRELEDIQRLADLYDYDCSLSYKTGLKAYKQNGFVSPVELIADKHIELDKRLKAIQDGL